MCETGNSDSQNRCAACGAPKPSASSSPASRSASSQAASHSSSGTAAASAASPASPPKGGSSLGVWAVILLIVGVLCCFVAAGDPMKLYRDVLLGSKTFTSGDTGATTTIHETYKCFEYDARYGSPKGFLLADVDNDGKDEVVVSLSDDEYRLVLDAQGMTVYGYLFTFRGMKRIFADGTFEYSSSAYDSGYGYARFSGRSRSVTRVSGTGSSPIVFFQPFSASNIETCVR